MPWSLPDSLTAAYWRAGAYRRRARAMSDQARMISGQVAPGREVREIMAAGASRPMAYWIRLACRQADLARHASHRPHSIGMWMMDP